MPFRIRNFWSKFLSCCVLFALFATFLLKFGIDTKQVREFELSEAKIVYSINKSYLDINKILDDKINDLDEIKLSQLKINEQIETNTFSVYKEVYSLERNLKKSNEKYMILEYTNVFFAPKFCSKSSEEIFNSQIEKCEFNNCEYTCDKLKFLSSADALIFHQRDVEAEFELKYNNFDEWFHRTLQIPFKTPEEKLKNNPEQIWILWNDEATKINSAFNSISKLFNWTLSFKTDAEIFEGSYGFFLPNKHISESDLIRYKEEIHENFVKRENAILWFVSNCKSKLRSRVALEISQYYPLHIYGKCDLSKDFTESEIKAKYPYLKVFSNEKCSRDSECELEKFQSYKYYLAFENTNCTDYVTEKIWKSLNKHMIPIALQPNRQSYQSFSIPSKSFIHLEDYDFNVRQLTNHLNSINQDFSLYYKYLKWTYVYLKTHNDGKETEPHRMCQLCKKLNTFKKRISYKRIADFFNDRCLS
ncbi:unnamed protein product [Brachionus calyciflorus]|uniref:Fucosyltransferase n=1 Tax=Brachionus calyciflorus TaxID=104777 RepID=A0A813MKN1_9BILA|nr:unnamed protein product [Brachionus calyciflorus]